MEQTNDTIKAYGNLVIELRDATGNLKDRREVKNLVVTAGRTYIASRMVGTASNVMSHMAVGTGTAAAAAANTGLGTEAARVTLTSSTPTGATVAYAATFDENTPASATAITEAGIFNASSGGTMLCRTTFNPINKSVGDTLTVNWNVTINASA